MADLLLINGPNLNLLGTREPDIYGSTTLEDIENNCRQHAKKLEFDIDFLNKTWFIDLLETKENNNLCHTLCKKITDEQLTIIASADYGFDADAFKDLKFIRDNAALPEKISFSLLETLSLTRYAKPVTTMGHQERLFACCCLALIENMDSVESEDGDILYALILSVIALGKKVLGQARTFLFNVLAKNKNTNSVHTIAYLILCCDLLLKDEKAFNGTFSFLKEINILEETNFEYESILTAKRVKDIPPPFMMFFIYKIVLIKQP